MYKPYEDTNPVVDQHIERVIREIGKTPRMEVTEESWNDFCFKFHDTYEGLADDFRVKNLYTQEQYDYIMEREPDLDDQMVYAEYYVE